MSKKSWSVHSALPYWHSFSVFYIAEKELVKIIILIPNLDLVTWYYPSCRLIVAMALIELAVDLGVGIFPTPHGWTTICSLQSTACGKLQILQFLNNIVKQTYMIEAVILCIVSPTWWGRSAKGNHWNIILCASQASPCQKQEDNVILSISIYHSSLKTSTKILESCNKHNGRQAWHRLWLALG